MTNVQGNNPAIGEVNLITIFNWFHFDYVRTYRYLEKSVNKLVRDIIILFDDETIEDDYATYLGDIHPP